MPPVYNIWVEEPDKRVWHGVVHRLAGGRLEAGCGWQLFPVRGKVWPVKRGDPGPLPANRCRACMDAD